MPLPSTYSTGTASVANGDATVTFVGAILGTAAQPNFQAGDLFADPSQPLIPAQRIESVDYDALTAELWVAWPGTSMTADPYEVRFTSDPIRSTAQSRRLLEQLSVVQANGRGLFYRFDDGTADADPGAGDLRLNHATIASATGAFLDNVDANGATVSAVVDTWDDLGISDDRGQLWVRSVATPSVFHVFRVTDTVVDGTGYRKLTLEYIGGSGSFVSADELMVMFAPTGSAGETGGTGADGGIAMTFDDPTADADPGAGKFRLNHATHASATAAYIDNAEAGGGSIGALLDTWDDSTATIKGTLQIIAQDDPSIWRTYSVSGSVVDSTGYRTVTIAYVGGNGTLVDETECSLFFSRTGNNGTNGTNGTNGVTPGLRYNFDTTTADADPGAGKFRLNHATHASATAAYIDNVDADGATVTGTLDTWDDSTATIRGVLTIRSAATPATFAQYSVTGSVVDGTGYRKLTLVYLAGNGTLGNGDAISVQFARTGNDGAAGFPDIDRRNQLLIAAGVAKALAGYQRHLDMVAFGFKASGDADATSTGGAVNTTTGAWEPAPATTVETSATPASGPAAAGFTMVDRSWSLDNGGVLNKIGFHSSSAQSLKVKVVRRDSATDYDVLVDEAFSHPGGGWADKTLSSNYSVPGSGTYYAAVYASANAHYNMSTARGFFSGDATGANVAFGEDTSNTFGIRATYITGVTNAALITPYQTADAARTKVRGIFEIDPVDAATLGTDWTVEYTCNGGTNWAAASTYTNCGKGQSGRTVVETEEVSCTSGTSFAARVKNLNAKNVHVYKASLKAAA